MRVAKLAGHAHIFFMVLAGVLCLFCLPGLTGCGEDTDTANEPALLAGANACLANLTDTEYQHTTDVDAAAGRYYFDCSGFIDYLIADVRPAAYKEIDDFVGHSGFREAAGRPLAFHFVLFASNLAHNGADSAWTPVPDLRKLAPGDILAWQQPPDSSSDDTGHVMLIKSNYGFSGEELLLRVIDSASSAHADDARCPLSECEEPDALQGLGEGTIGLRLEENGTGPAYRWSGGKDYSSWHTTDIRALRLLE